MEEGGSAEILGHIEFLERIIHRVRLFEEAPKKLRKENR
jgi:hypothetical protein